MVVKFLVDLPAAFIEEKKILIVADLHIGIEQELYHSGILINPQAEKFGKTITKILEKIGAKTLAILGDVKHEVPGITFREIKQIPKFFEMIPSDCKILIAKGNHDTSLEDIIPENVKICDSKGFKIGNYGFFHGHAWPSKSLLKCKFLFMGHVHPVVEFKDRIGYRTVEQVWIKGWLDRRLVKSRYKVEASKAEIVIVPAFNKMLGGVVLNAEVEKGLIGPLLVNKFLDIEMSKVYMLDGTYLGLLKNLKERF